MFSSLQRRSSLASSYVTGLVGWNGLGIIVLLLLGYQLPILNLMLVLTGIALVQVTMLRLLFRPLQLDKGLWVGAIWGALTGGLLVWLLLQNLPVAISHSNFWLLLTGSITGLAVGIFLSYFYRDDLEIESEQANPPEQANYGRDAHWLEPFAYGAVSYMVVFLPFDFNLAGYVFIVGAMSGVYAAGASHFSPDHLKQNMGMILLICLVVGGVQGGLSGFLFRQYHVLLWQSPLLLGALAGFITYTWTFLRGRQLARQEKSL